MSEIRSETIVRWHPEASHRVIGGAAVIVLSREAQILTLNSVGTRIWTLLGGDEVSSPTGGARDEGPGAPTVGEVAAALAEEYDVEAGRALEDTVRLLDELRQRGAVVIAGSKEA